MAVRNGLDLLESALDHFDNEDDRSMKFAVLHLHAAIETLCKARLCREHWTLVVDMKTSTAPTPERFARGELKSISFDEARTRLRIVSVRLEESEATLKALQDERNRIAHYAPGNVKTLRAKVLKSLGPVLELLVASEAADMGDEETQRLAGVRARLLKNKELVAQEVERLNSGTEADRVVTCPYCFQRAGVLNEPFHCLYCGTREHLDYVADRYAGTVVKAKPDENGHFMWPVHGCPQCRRRLLVAVVPQDRVGEKEFRCFGCRRTVARSAMDYCDGDECGRLRSSRATLCVLCTDQLRDDVSTPPSAGS